VVFRRGILNAAIGMVDQAWTGPLRGEGHPYVANGKVGPQMILRRPALDYAAVEIQVAGQIDIA
jgi:hypothetical protein